MLNINKTRQIFDEFGVNMTIKQKAVLEKNRAQMRAKFPVILTIMAVMALADLGFCTKADRPFLKAMIVTGQNNHDWKVSSPIFKQILDDSGVFKTDLATSPEKGGDMSAFDPQFNDYDVVVLDYNGEMWNEGTRQAFLEYVKNGGGVVVIHAADNAFRRWDEYNKVIGLRWGGNEKTGPYIRFRDGKVVRDMTPGSAGGHGPQHTFVVINRVTDHPVTKGLPEKWMHARDELYSSLRGPAENLTVLSTAYADPEKGGTGEHEPVLFTIRYGKGRVFHDVLGHVKGSYPPPAVECAGFIVTFQRGAEWAATGKVTQSLPKDFPSATRALRWKGYKPAMLADLLKRCAEYDYGKNLKAFDQLVNMINAANGKPRRIKKIEQEILPLLTADIPLAAKRLFCKQLNAIGSDSSVKTLSGMLDDPKTADMARYALEGIAGDKVNKALRQKLTTASGNTKVGIINTLGVLQDSRSVSVLRKMVYDPDEQTAYAAITALGKIGGKNAALTLKQAKDKTTGRLQMEILHSYLNCLAGQVRLGQAKNAAKEYQQLYKGQVPEIIRIAALKGMVQSDPANAGKILVDVIRKGDPGVGPIAFQLVGEISDRKALDTLTKELPKLSVSGQVQLITALDHKADRTFTSAVVKMTDSSNRDVRNAALKALAALGDKSTVALLAKTAAHTSGSEQQAARTSLYRLKGKGVDENIIEQIPAGDTKVKIELILAADERFISGAVPTLLKTAADADISVRVKSIKVLKTLAESKDIPMLIGILTETADSAERKGIEKVLVTAARKTEGNNKSAQILDVIDKIKDVDDRCSLLSVLGMLGNDSSLPVLRKALKSDNDKLKDTAIRALVKWQRPAPMPDLMEIVKTDTNATRQILALRGYIGLISKPSDRTSDESVNLLAGAMAQAKRPEEKRLILSLLTDYEGEEALQLAKSCLGDEAIASEAAFAIKKLDMTSLISTPNKHGGISPVAVNDGKFEIQNDDEGDGTVCWVFGGYFYNRVAKEFCKDIDGHVQVELTYRDYGRGNITLQYDSTDGSAPVKGAYKQAEKVAKLTNSGKWRSEIWTLEDARFNKRQNGGSDYRFSYTGGEAWVSRIRVFKKPK